MLVRDPVWGDIELPHWCQELLDTEEMQRLRHVRQLGFAYLVYPGAQHSRFEHSLGTAHMAQAILAAVGRSEDEWAEAVVAAALLHDVAHAPFGHTFEDERPLFPRHDTPQRLGEALSGELGRRLEALPCGGRARLLLQGGNDVPNWAQDIVAGPLDADLLDYLRRDAYFTGVRHQYDERVLHTLALLDGRLGVRLARHGRARPDARSEILQLFRMRYVLTERVYLHHTKIAAGAMLARAVETAAQQGLRVEEIARMGDDALLGLLGSGAFGPDAACLAQAIGRRRLHKRALVLGRRELGPEGLAALAERLRPELRHAEAEIAAQAGLRACDVTLSCPPQPEFREMRVPTELPEGICPLDAPPGGDMEVEVLRERYRDLWQIAVFARADVAELAARAAQAVFRL